jgi:hypothetical protein
LEGAVVRCGVERRSICSPDGSASFDFYTTAVTDQPITEHMKSFAFGEGDEITSLAGERAWIAASGFKGDRLFYRKAALACYSFCCNAVHSARMKIV